LNHECSSNGQFNSNWNNQSHRYAGRTLVLKPEQSSSGEYLKSLDHEGSEL
jgi:hypothetical protein